MSAERSHNPSCFVFFCTSALFLHPLSPTLLLREDGGQRGQKLRCKRGDGKEEGRGTTSAQIRGRKGARSAENKRREGDKEPQNIRKGTSSAGKRGGKGGKEGRKLRGRKEYRKQGAENEEVWGQQVQEKTEVSGARSAENMPLKRGGGAEEGAATALSPLLLLLPLLPKGRSQEGRGRSCREGEQSHHGKNYQTSILGGAKRHQTCGGSGLSALLRVVLPSGNRCGGFLCPVVRDARKDRQRPPSPRCCRNPAPKFLPSAERASKATRVKTIKLPS